MIQLVKGIFYRIWNGKTYLIMPLIITPLIVFASIYFTSKLSVKANIAVVGYDNINISSSDIKVTKLAIKPNFSDLVKNKYDAVITFNNGGLTVETVKGEEFKNNIKAILKGSTPTWEKEVRRGVGSNIVGYLTMFMFLLGVMLFKFFYEEKKGICKRVLTSQVSYLQYALGHCTVVFLMIFLPITIMVLVSKYSLNLDTNLSNLQFVFIIGVLALFVTAFGFFIASLINQEENAALVGAMITVITTLLSGSFFAVTNKGLSKDIANFLPQKYILDFTINLENNSNGSYISMFIISIIAFILIFIGIGIDMSKLRANKC